MHTHGWLARDGHKHTAHCATPILLTWIPVYYLTKNANFELAVWNMYHSVQPESIPKDLGTKSNSKLFLAD
jgi:hypothetical protein